MNSLGGWSAHAQCALSSNSAAGKAQRRRRGGRKQFRKGKRRERGHEEALGEVRNCSVAALLRPAAPSRLNVSGWRKSGKILLPNCVVSPTFQDLSEAVGQKTEDGARVKKERGALPRQATLEVFFFNFQDWRKFCGVEFLRTGCHAQ